MFVLLLECESERECCVCMHVRSFVRWFVCLLVCLLVGIDLCSVFDRED